MGWQPGQGGGAGESPDPRAGAPGGMPPARDARLAWFASGALPGLTASPASRPGYANLALVREIGRPASGIDGSGPGHLRRVSWEEGETRKAGCRPVASHRRLSAED